MVADHRQQWGRRVFPPALPAAPVPDFAPPAPAVSELAPAGIPVGDLCESCRVRFGTHVLVLAGDSAAPFWVCAGCAPGDSLGADGEGGTL